VGFFNLQQKESQRYQLPAQPIATKKLK